MTEILGYSLDENQCVKDLGKFEGEPAYAPFLWLSDGEDERLDCDSVYYSIYFVDDELRAKFPTLLNASDYAIALWESEQGFVDSESFTKQQYDAFVSDCESSQSNDDEE